MISTMAQRPTSNAIKSNPPQQDRPYTREERSLLKLRMKHQGFPRKKRTRCFICSRINGKKSRGYCKSCWEKLQPSEREKEFIAERAKQGRSCGTCDATFGACLHTRAALKMEMNGECFIHTAPDPKCRDCRSWQRRRGKS